MGCQEAIWPGDGDLQLSSYTKNSNVWGDKDLDMTYEDVLLILGMTDFWMYDGPIGDDFMDSNKKDYQAW